MQRWMIMLILALLVLTGQETLAGAREVARDGPFIAYEDGTVLDTRTNLMWAARDNGSDINWSDAERYCESYRGGGYADWRMPTLEELTGLYDRSRSYKPDRKQYDVYLTSLIELSSAWVWASGIRGSDGAGVFFGYGGRSCLPQSLDCEVGHRALPVRSGK